jgi:hypothetical protein
MRNICEKNYAKGESVVKEIYDDLIKELAFIPAFGKVSFELTFCDSEIQRLLVKREVSRLYND